MQTLRGQTYNAFMATARVFRTLSAGVLLTPAWAAANDGYAVEGMASATPWLAILYTVIALGGASVVAFKNSKRTHLD